MLWLVWAVVSLPGLAWGLQTAFALGAWWPFWAILSACVGAGGWLGGYHRAAWVGAMGAAGVFVSAALRGADQPLPLLEWAAPEWWPVAAASLWANAGWLAKRRGIFWETLGCAVIAASFLAFWGLGFIEALLIVEAGFLLILFPYVGGGIGRVYRMGRLALARWRGNRRRGVGGAAAGVAVARAQLRSGENKTVDSR